MGRSPHTPENLALARATLTDLDLLSQCGPEHRAELVRLAQAILRTDRICRDGIETQPALKTGAVVIVPLALWQAGLRARRITATAKPALPTTPTPGDAA